VARGTAGGARALAPVLIAALAVSLGACGGDDDDPPEISQRVVDTARAQKVSEAQLAARVDALRRATPDDSGTPDSQLQRQAVDDLVRARRLERAARQRGIAVSDAEVRARWESSVRDQFPTKEALDRFLGEQTVDDVIYQLRLQELSSRIQDRIRRKVGKQRAAAAIKRFERQLQQQ
jgi:hypothetical protein